jgi:hypothetical protein
MVKSVSDYLAQADFELMDILHGLQACITTPALGLKFLIITKL